MNIAVIYGILAAVALVLAASYCALIKKKEIWLVLLCISVFVVNTGYFSLAISKTLEEALLANRIAYLGSVFLPLCMLMTILDACGFRPKKVLTGFLIFISVGVFLLAASGGYTDLYYKEVSLIFVNGAAKLEKVYGDLHIVYLIYLMFHFISMIASIVVSLIKKISTYKYAAMLTSVVFLNILIWFMEQLVYTDFEFLSVSYIASEFLLMFLYSLTHEKTDVLSATVTESAPEITKQESEAVEEQIEVPETQEKEYTQAIVALIEQFKLTSRESEVLRLIVEGKKRKDIAQELFLSENTVKTHTSHLFAKLNVGSKTELLEAIEIKSSKEEMSV